MPNRDGKGPRTRSPKPSKPKGGNGRGNCWNEAVIEQWN